MKELIIKGRVIGEGQPLVCVPIMDKKKEDIIESARKLVEKNAEMIEWRVDAFEDPVNLNALRGVLEELAPITKDTILVYTFRSKKQGGLLQLMPEQIYDIHQIAAETHVVDLIDVELFSSEQPQKEIKELHRMGARVIVSHHDFDQTPKLEIMIKLLHQMNETGADIVKLAVMPQENKDVLSLMYATNLFHEEYPHRPVVTMSMGGTGCISRIAGELTGSCVTFGAGEQASAPGQLPMEELTAILCLLHRQK